MIDRLVDGLSIDDSWYLGMHFDLEVFQVILEKGASVISEDALITC